MSSSRNSSTLDVVVVSANPFETKLGVKACIFRYGIMWNLCSVVHTDPAHDIKRVLTNRKLRSSGSHPAT